MTYKKQNKVSSLQQSKAKDSQGGYSILEISLALVVIAFIVSGIVVSYQNVTEDNKTNIMVQQLSKLQNAVFSLYGGQSNYNGLKNSVLITGGAIPISMVTGTDSINHAFKGEVIIESANNDNAYSVEFKDVPVRACSKIAVLELSSNLTEISINGKKHSSAPAIADAVKDCNSNSPAKITWNFAN